MKIPEKLDYDTNVQYHPEKWGLTVVADIDYCGRAYEFDTRIVWRDEEGVLWTARDSGCSCPCPFEDVIPERFSLEDIEEEVQKEFTKEYYEGENPSDFLAKIRAAAKLVDVAPRGVEALY